MQRSVLTRVQKLDIGSRKRHHSILLSGVMTTLRARKRNSKITIMSKMTKASFRKELGESSTNKNSLQNSVLGEFLKLSKSGVSTMSPTTAKPKRADANSNWFCMEWVCKLKLLPIHLFNMLQQTTSS